MYPSYGSANVLQGAKSNYFARFSTHKKLPCLFPPSSRAFSRLIPLLQTFIGSKNRQKRHQLQIAHLLDHWNKRIRRKMSHDLLSFEKDALDFNFTFTKSPFLYFPLSFKLASKANMEQCFLTYMLSTRPPNFGLLSMFARNLMLQTMRNNTRNS